MALLGPVVAQPATTAPAAISTANIRFVMPPMRCSMTAPRIGYDRWMLKAGLVGSGFVARIHVEALRRVAEPIAVFSPTPARREAFAAEHAVAPVGSLAELIDAVDVVHVCAPASTHEEVAVAALSAGVHVVVEKPFTGYFGAATTPHRQMLEAATGSAGRMVAADRASAATLCYAENFVYAPAVQREAEIVRKTDAQILRMVGEESHSGSHSPFYGMWRHMGGGSLIGKGCHPLTAMLYLKRLEGITRLGTPILPATATARVHELTRLPTYRDAGHLRTDYDDIEDFAMLHVTFDDGTVGDVFASEVVLGGVINYVEVHANNHRTRCNLNPIDALETFNPVGARLDDVYVVEKIETKEGWSKPAPDEDWMHGYPAEIEEFYRCIGAGERPDSDAELGYATVATIYAGYVSAEERGAEVEVPSFVEG